MKVSDLKTECEADGATTVTCWLKLASPDDVDDAMAWLRLAKDMMIKWEKVRGKNARAAQAPKAPTSQNENPQPRQVQSES